MEGKRAVVSFRDSCVCVRAETQKLNLRATLVTRFPDFVRPFPGKVFDHSLNGPLVINYRGRAKILCSIFIFQVFFLFFFFPFISCSFKFLKSFCFESKL